MICVVLCGAVQGCTALRAFLVGGFLGIAIEWRRAREGRGLSICRSVCVGLIRQSASQPARWHPANPYSRSFVAKVVGSAYLIAIATVGDNQISTDNAILST